MISSTTTCRTSRLPRSLARLLFIFALVAGATVATPRAAHAQSTFGLQLFRPAVDSKGYVTVNASQILGHLDFSIGLVGSYARNVMTLAGPGGTRFGVTDYFTPQLQAAIGFFKWVELGVSLPVHIVAGRRGYDGKVSSTSEQHFSQDEARLDRLAGAPVVGDQQVDARQPERLAERQELIGIEADSRAEGGLEEVAVGGGRRAPADRAEVGREHLGVVSAGAGKSLPALIGEAFSV